MPAEKHCEVNSTRDKSEHMWCEYTVRAPLARRQQHLPPGNQRKQQETAGNQRSKQVRKENVS
eukprot:13755294-Alexandrium_andersonii.AAC.1